MAISTTEFHVERPALRARFDRFFSALASAYTAYANSRSRIGEIRALEAKSDAELKAMGIKRDQIAQYVFRDVFYV